MGKRWRVTLFLDDWEHQMLKRLERGLVELDHLDLETAELLDESRGTMMALASGSGLCDLASDALENLGIAMGMDPVTLGAGLHVLTVALPLAHCESVEVA